MAYSTRFRMKREQSGLSTDESAVSDNAKSNRTSRFLLAFVFWDGWLAGFDPEENQKKKPNLSD